ncbi:MAG: hypothetical protein ACK5TG_10035 [Planctomyces sp.]|jgi:hypothetical protein
MADLATDIDFEVFCVVFGKSGNAALAGKDVFPESPTIISQTTDNPDSRNENPLHSFGPTPANNDDRLWLKTCIPARPTRPWVLPLQYEPGKQGIQGVLKQTSAGLQPSGGVFAVIGAELVRGILPDLRRLPAASWPEFHHFRLQVSGMYARKHSSSAIFPGDSRCVFSFLPVNSVVVTL